MNPDEAEDSAREAGPGLAAAAPGAAGAAPGTALAAARHGPDPGGLLYGTIVSAAALAVGAIRGDTVAAMTETMVTTLLIYWLAHVYVGTLNRRRPGRSVPLRRLIAASARHEAPILLGGLPAVTVAVILSFSRVSPWVTVLSDLGVVIVVLALDGLMAGLYAGTRGWRLGLEAASAALFGGLVAALLVFLHRH